MSLISDFQPAQIVCLDCQDTRLYAEVIQTVPERHLCWARPLVMQVADRLYDLRQGADLLLPIALFRSALDTEVIPCLTQLHDRKLPDGDRLSHQRLRAFLQQLCHAHPEAFQT